MTSNADQPIKQRAAQLCHENQANIDHFVDNFDAESFERAIKLISEARRVTITDLASSPLTANAKASIFVPHHSSFTSNSIISYLAAAECIINAVPASSSKQTEQALIARQELIKRLNIEERLSKIWCLPYGMTA
ncbi:hypothetical protein [Yoonia sediminilitoris]|uniref:Uncharacterized protein n=1 Tax=Yoonia sediminilitoris TaxID=1286148 RepID=A0A2T6KK23_9RHOB|nr:hypothetical protein [Yoonia sediminilitoris]PUB16259.1 hypothetical protein C8N45_103113 [Yoonia sediminilitoris]RCW96608.1 hypothetical protein DFP92_103113 [Yoonia sediminilitoris]